MTQPARRSQRSVPRMCGRGEFRGVDVIGQCEEGPGDDAADPDDPLDCELPVLLLATDPESTVASEADALGLFSACEPSTLR